MNRPEMQTIALASLLALAGCQQQAEYGVTGQVTLDDDPLPNATISFIPTDDTLTAAVARTDEQGNYTVAISSDRHGLAPGTYSVRITTYDEGDMEADPPLPPVRELVPSKYNYDSELSVEVERDVNSFDFHLNSKGKIESN